MQMNQYEFLQFISLLYFYDILFTYNKFTNILYLTLKPFLLLLLARFSMSTPDCVTYVRHKNKKVIFFLFKPTAYITFASIYAIYIVYYTLECRIEIKNAKGFKTGS